MRKSRFGIAAVSALALYAVAVPAYASTFIFSPTDGDESKYFFNKKSLSNSATGATFFGSTPGNTTTDNVDVTTVGTISNLGNGFGSVDGKDSGSDFLTSLTFTPATGTTFDGIFFRGQLQVEDGVTSTGVVHIAVTGVDNVVTNLTKSGLGIEEDITDLGIEAENDTDLIKSVTISTDSGEYFKEFKQVQFSGVAGGSVVGTGGVPEPATWIVMIAGFGLLGALLRRRARTLDTCAN